MNEQVKEFARRFGNFDWNNGNCYYFAVILRTRFNGSVFYDTIAGHFVCRIYDKFYDSNGEYTPCNPNAVILWRSFKDYDELQYRRVMAQCVL